MEYARFPKVSRIISVKYWLNGWQLITWIIRSRTRLCWRQRFSLRTSVKTMWKLLLYELSFPRAYQESPLWDGVSCVDNDNLSEDNAVSCTCSPMQRAKCFFIISRDNDIREIKWFLVDSTEISHLPKFCQRIEFRREDSRIKQYFTDAEQEFYRTYLTGDTWFSLLAGTYARELILTHGA